MVRVQESARPVAPEVCLPWLTGVELDSPDITPGLNATCEDRDKEGNPILLPASPDAQNAWDHYLADEWARWAPKAATARQTRSVYQKLFAVYQQVEAAADTVDLFVGVGLFHSRVDSDQLFRRHLLAFSAELTLDERSGTLILGPSADFTTARVEADFIPTTTRARLLPQIEKLREDLEGVGGGLAQRTVIDDIVTRLITPLSALTRYLPDLTPAEAQPNGAVVSFAPALILRPRSARSLEALLDRIEKDTSGETPKHPTHTLPVPWRKMVEDGSAWDAASAEAYTGGPPKPTTDACIFLCQAMKNSHG